MDSGGILVVGPSVVARVAAVEKLHRHCFHEHRLEKADSAVSALEITVTIETATVTWPRQPVFEKQAQRPFFLGQYLDRLLDRLAQGRISDRKAEQVLRQRQDFRQDLRQVLKQDRAPCSV
jgi:hypothetical protein